MEGGLLSRRVLGIVSDLHCGSTVGLHPDTETELDDGGAYLPSKAQRWIWDNWLTFLREAGATADESPLDILVNGDLVDGAHHGTTQIVSNHPNVQMDILRRSFEPVLALHPDSLTIIRGTEVHVGPNGSAEESFAASLARQGLNVTREVETGNHSHWHFRGDVGGVLVDATHHGRVGGRPWTKVNGTMSLAAEITMEHAMRKERIPDLAIRSHFHQWVDTGDAFPVRVLQTPAWQLGTAYVKRRHAESLADIGGAIVVIEDGQITEVRKRLFRPARPAVVTL